MLLPKETHIILDVNSIFNSIRSDFTLANDLKIYSFACCIGVQLPKFGDKYIGLGAVIFPCNYNKELHNNMIYGNRINKYYNKTNESYILWEYKNEDICSTWGNIITKDKEESNTIRNCLQNEFAYVYANCMFRYNYFTILDDVKSQCIRNASNIADIFNMSVANMVEDRINKIKEGYR